MTTGTPLYLVSACGSAEEFVAAFRRYADRTGLFIPAAAPLPAGRRGRIAVTLKDGGVMIEGEAEILQSSAKPTVLYGRPGMTVKFVEPDEPSKIVIGELEKARLAMKVPAPSVPPRPAKDLPAEPRPTPPAVGGRIDATNALAECVVIGDPSTLKETASGPKGFGGAGPGKFVVPSIPSAPGARPKTPSVPPVPAAVPKEPSKPTPVPLAKEPSKPTPAPLAKELSKPTPVPLAKEPSKPTPVPLAKEPSKPTPVVLGKEPSKPIAVSSKMTSIGFPAIDKQPADMGRAAPVPVKPVEEPKPAENPLLSTKLGTEAPANPTKEIKAEKPPLDTQHGVAVSKAPARPLTDDEATSIGEGPPKKTTDPMPTTVPPKTAEQPVAAPKGPVPDPPRVAKQSHKATSIGFPAMRTPFETQPVGVVPSSTPGDPAAPIVAKPKAGLPGPRGKSPTTPPLTPRHPTPVAPLPIVRSPAKTAAPVEDEEKTDLSAVPPVSPDKSSGAISVPPVDADVPSGDAEAAMPQSDTISKSQIASVSRSGGMRASEIMAAIGTTEDWTMTPDASGPTVLPASNEPTPEIPEPTPAPSTPPKGPPTGNWTISLDPETGWGEPEKLAPTAVPPPRAPEPAPQPKPKSGNPDIAVASKEAFTAVEWEEKPTGIGEAKIEIDATLMEPLKPMPALDDEPKPAPLAARSDIPPPLAPMPPSQTAGFPAAALMTPVQGMPIPRPPTTEFPGYNPMATGFPQPPASMHELGASGSVMAVPEPRPSKKRTLIIVAAAAVAVIAGFLLVLALSGGKKSAKSKPNEAHGSAAIAIPDKGSAQPTVAMTPDAAEAGSAVDEGSAGSAGSAAIAVQTPDHDGSAETPVAPVTHDGPCHVDVASVPTGADVYLGKTKLGTTPGNFELPCGTESTLLLRKVKFAGTERSIKPSADKANKLVVKLGRVMFSVKVTSTPAGATITAAGKNAGVTPATIRLPGYEASTITLNKPGYAADSQRVTPKTNGISHHVTLKKSGRR